MYISQTTHQLPLTDNTSLKVSGGIEVRQDCTVRNVSTTSKKYFYSIIYTELN